jgi:predicted amidophosphoribosyltransferase
LNAPLEKHLIKRNIHSVPQMSLPAKARQKNIRGIFSVNRHINGEHITVIDDVMTSGATANEIARVLKKAGASRVDIWTFARA